MTDKAIKETVTRLKAHAECFKKKTGRTSMIECFESLCDGCTLDYAQGTAAEHLKDIETAIRVLEKQPCEDAVSRQRVIEELRYMDNNGCITRSVNHVIDDIRSIPSVKPLDNQQQWIPADERLPEAEGYYIVTDDAGGMITVELSFFVPGCEAPWDYANVTAWMPLPAPYKGDEDD